MSEYDVPMEDGTVRPLASTPQRELEVWRNAELRASLGRGLEQSAAGKVYDLGSFRERICSGCGETYLPDEYEGNLHDHWTAADDA